MEIENQASSQFQIKKISLKCHREGELSSYYEVVKELGKGGFGKVNLMKDLKSQQLKAIKYVTKKSIDNDTAKKEIDMGVDLDHPHIANFIQSYEDKENLYLVLEYCEGGQLFERIVKEKALDIETIKKITRDLVSALKYCHQVKNLSHRDIKPENILFKTTDKDSIVKLVDFGCAQIGQLGYMNTYQGTVRYMAPEVIKTLRDKKQYYSEKCDIWSLGIIMYLMLCGIQPFQGKTKDDDKKAILRCLESDFKPSDLFVNLTIGNDVFDISSKFAHVPENLKDLIINCIKPEKDRFDIQQVYDHPFLQVPKNENAQKLEEFCLQSYTRANSLTKLAFNHMSLQLTEKDIKQIRETFEQHDTNGDGQLSLQEFKQALEKIKIPDAEKIFPQIDVDHDGHIDYNEFVAVMDQQCMNMTDIAQTFNYFSNGTQFIGIEDFHKICQANNTTKQLEENEWKKIIDELDKNQDGQISLKEFEDAFKKFCEKCDVGLE